MAASNLYMNWGSVSVTPTSPSASAIALSKILDVKLDSKSVQKTFFGDNVQFPVLIRNVQKSRSITLVGGDVAKLLSIPEDSECTISAVLLDAVNGTGTGAITITAVRAKRGGAGVNGQNNEFSTSEVTFTCAGGASDADPITLSVAS